MEFITGKVKKVDYRCCTEVCAHQGQLVSHANTKTSNEREKLCPFYPKPWNYFQAVLCVFLVGTVYVDTVEKYTRLHIICIDISI